MPTHSQEKDPSPATRHEDPPTIMERIRVVGYEIFIDPMLEDIREFIAELIARNSSVIDIGCGSGALAFHLAKNNGCTVHGTDLAAEKMKRANQRKKDTNCQKVDFTKADATNLEGIADQQFDYATMSLFLHALPENIRQTVIKEAMRVAKQVVIADYVTKQPISLGGIAVRGIEMIAGIDHFRNFKSFRANGGLEPLLERAGLAITDEKLNPSGTIRVVRAKRI